MARPARPLPQRLRIQLRYLWALVKRFKITFILLGVVQLGGSLVLWLWYTRHGHGVTLPQAMGATYFLMMGQPSLEMPDSWWLMLFEALIPVLGLAVLADGLVRFGFLFFAKHRNDKEWIAVQAQTMKGHVVLCGAGRIGYRVLERLHLLGVDVVVVERNENAPFVQALRNQGVPLLIDDVRTGNTLASTNIKAARAIVCATDDDLANLNIALDARRMNPKIRVVMRLFDDDLVQKVQDAFQVDAFSTSALAAPAFAAAALDVNVRTSFELDGHLVVVGDLTLEAGSPLAGRTVGQCLDDLGVRVLRLQRGTAAATEPHSPEGLQVGDKLVIQATLDRYQQLSPRDAPATSTG